MSEQVTATPEAGSEGADGASQHPDPMSDAALDAAAVAMAENLGVGDDATPPATPGAPAEPFPGQDAPAASSAAAVEAARIEALVNKQLEVRQHQSRLEQRLAAIEAENKELRAFKDGIRGRLKEDPLAVVAEEGWDAEALAGAMVGAKNPEKVAMRQLQAELKALKAEREAEREQARAAAEEAQARATAAKNVAEYKARAVHAPLKAKESEYLYLIAEHDTLEGAVDRVYSEMDRIWRERGQEVPADAVAKVLNEQAKKRFEVISGKVKTPAAAVAAPPKPKPKTLSNNLTQAHSDDDDLSDAALTRKAIEFARNADAG